MKVQQVQEWRTRVAFRVASYDDVSPFNPFPTPQVGRWSAVNARVVSYWSIHPHGPWAETYRWAEIRTEVDVAAHVSERLWVGRFEHVQPLVVNDAVARRYGLSSNDLVGDDYTPCQQAADRMTADGHDEILVPSAALIGDWNLVLFSQRLPIPYWEDPEGPTDVPCGVIAEESPGVISVVSHVHHLGTPPATEPYTA